MLTQRLVIQRSRSALTTTFRLNFRKLWRKMKKTTELLHCLKDLHALSEPTTHLDQFWSHSWHGSQWTKYANMLYLHNCMPASIAGILSASVACGLVSAGFLGARQGWCLLFGFVAFCITLLLWHPRKLVFLDIACIHQTDDARRGEAIMSMGAFLNRSTSMLVLWDPTWVTRLRLGFISVLL